MGATGNRVGVNASRGFESRPLRHFYIVKVPEKGQDPVAEKREARLARQRPATPTFAKASEIVIEMQRPTWTNAKHAAQWHSALTTLELLRKRGLDGAHAYPLSAICHCENAVRHSWQSR